MWGMVTCETVGGVQSPEDEITRTEAADLHSTAAAWLVGGLGLRGSLAPGRLADFTVRTEDSLIWKARTRKNSSQL
jgi:predicted amidohydrolase YtcJ